MQIFKLQVNLWSGVMWIITMMFYQLFGLSFWRHPFTAEDLSVSGVMLHFSKSVPVKKKLLRWPEGEYIFISSIPLNTY